MTAGNKLLNKRNVEARRCNALGRVAGAPWWLLATGARFPPGGVIWLRQMRISQAGSAYTLPWHCCALVSSMPIVAACIQAKHDPIHPPRPQPPHCAHPHPDGCIAERTILRVPQSALGVPIAHHKRKAGQEHWIGLRSEGSGPRAAQPQEEAPDANPFADSHRWRARSSPSFFQPHASWKVFRQIRASW